MAGLRRIRGMDLVRRGGRHGFAISGAVRSWSIRSAVTVTRSTEASYQTGATTDGSSAFLAWATTNTARWQDRGDGTTRLFLEGSRTNLIPDSRDVTAGTWTDNGNFTQTGNVGNGPDGTAVADRFLQGASGGAAYSKRYIAFASVPVTNYYICSTWVRASSATSFARLVNYSAVAAGSVTWDERTLTTTYERMAAIRNCAATTSLVHRFDHRDYTGAGGTGSPASADLRADLHQIEQAAYYSSPIRTSGGTATRGADVATLALTSAPGFVRNGSFSFVIRPEFTSAEFINQNATACLFEFDESGNEHVDMIVAGGAVKLQATSGGATKVTTGAITFTSRWQALTITVVPSAGTITVAGATTGNGTTTGTAYTVTPGTTLYIGNNKAGTNPYFGELEETLNAA